MTICLTTYRRSHVLAKSVDSILSQTYGDFELIISDDNSPDNTEEICRRYAGNDRRIRYFRNEANLRMPGNLNAALRRARGEYIANLHDGDTYRRDLIEKWKHALDQYPTAGFVFNALEVVDYQGKHVHTFRHAYPPLIPGRQLLDEMLDRWDSPVWGTVMARRSCYKAVGPFDSRFGFVSDVDMWMRMALQYDVAYVAEPLIQITPRESDHPYAFVNWEINAICEEMHRINLQRRHADAPGELQRALKRLRRRRDQYWIRDLISCLVHQRGGLFREGLRYCRRSDSVLLRVIGTLGYPVNLLFGFRPR